MLKASGGDTGGGGEGLVVLRMKKQQFVCNSSGEGIAAPVDASYYKGCGLRAGIEREFVVMMNYKEG